MWRPNGKINIFDPTNPEYTLVDAMTAEKFENYSWEIVYWSFNIETTAPTLDALDQTYGEASDVQNKYDGPFEAYGTIEVNPILQELTKLGHQQIEEINFYCNISAMDNYLQGRIPKQGDIIRVSWIKTDSTRRFVFYGIGNVTPVDPYNARYTNWLMHCEQTNMNEIPEEIKNFNDGR